MPDKITDEGRAFDRLPKWARTEIERLRRDLADAKERLAAGPENSNTFADPYLDKKPLGTDTTVEFRLASGGKVRVRIARDRGGTKEYVDVMHVGRHACELAIRPSSSNTFEVIEVDR